MRFSHQVGDIEAIRAANLATQDAEMQRIAEAARIGLATAVVAGVAATALSGCGGASREANKIRISPVPAVECSDSSGQTSGEIDNWAHGGVIKAWDGKSMVMSYVLQPGDNLTKVASCFFTDPKKGAETLARQNRIENANVISVGQKLEITIKSPVMVELGDEYESVEGLAARTGLGVNQIFAANQKRFRKEDWNPDSNDPIRLPVEDNNETSPTTTTSSTTTTIKSGSTTTTTKPSPTSPGEKPPRNAEIDEFRLRWDKYAQAVSDKFGIDKNAILAQAILESDYGSSELAIDGSNLFGVKAHKGAKNTPYWSGETMLHETTEYLTDSDLKDPYWQKRLVKNLGKTSDGLNEVRVNDDFRVYDTFMLSFMDYGYKITHEKTYAKAAAQIGKDPVTYIKAVAAAGYASDPEYITKVTQLYTVLDELSKAGEPEPTDPQPPKPGNGNIISSDELDFTEFPTQERDKALKETIKEATTNLSLAGFREFRRNGVLDKYDFVKGVMNRKGEYHQLLGRQLGDDFEFVVWHLWANGIADEDVDARGGTASSSSRGNSHDIPLESQVNSWHNGFINGHPTSAQYLIGDNGEVWQLTKTDTDNKALHAGYGVQDEGVSSFPDVNNENSTGIEVQADTIYDVSDTEMTLLMYQTVNLLIQGNIINKNMSASEIREAVNASVIGHGKNDSKFNDSGVEFGWKYRKPLIQGVQELAVAYLKG